MFGCNYYNGAGFGHWFFSDGVMGFLIIALIIIIIAVFIFQLFKSNRSINSETLDKKDSFEILKIRFAKGEISDQEFQKMKEILRL